MRELTLNEIEQVDGANVSTSTVLGVGAAITGVGAVVLTIAAVGVAAPILAPAAAVYGWSEQHALRASTAANFACFTP